MERAEVISLCQRLIGRETSALSAEDKALVAYVYREVVGRPLKQCRCRNKYSDALIEVYRRVKMEDKAMAKSNYKLKAGVVIMLKGDTTPYTNDNLTDKVAKAFLKDNPNATGRFEVIPAEEVAQAPKTKSKKTSKARA